MTVKVLEARPAPAHDAVARARPGWTRRGIFQVHDACPPTARTLGSPSCLAPLLYRTASEHRAVLGKTTMLIVISLPCTTREGPAPNSIAVARPLAEPVNTP